MTSQQALDKAYKLLSLGSSSSYLDAEVLLSFVLNLSRTELLTRSNLTLTKAQEKKFFSLVGKRKRHFPIAYLTGHKEFYGHDFFVNKNVLIPRPETEILVDLGVKYIQNQIHADDPKILDLGTGSGCIIISIAKSLTDPKIQILKSRFQLTASDISSKALAVTKKNLFKHKIKARLVKSNLFDKISGRYDLITANLPYVTHNEYRKEKSIQKEPKLALVGSRKDWSIYKDFISQVPEYLNPGSIAILEINPKSVNYLKKVLKKSILEYSFANDYSHKNRFLILTNGQKKHKIK